MERFKKRLVFTAALTHQIYAFISQIEELKGQWKAGAHLSPHILGRLKKSVIVTSTGASTRIEGAQLSDEDVERLLKGLKIQKLKTRDEQEVAGYAELLSNVFNSFTNTRLSESTIKHFHSELLKYSEKDQRHRGNYKFCSNWVEAKDADGKVVGVLFNPTPPHLVGKEMNELVAWTLLELDTKEIHPLLIIGSFIFEFLSIHPFQDGNGRVSRVLTNLLLLKSGYEYIPYVSHEKLVEDNKEDYYLALNKAQKLWKIKRENISTWLMFFLTILLEQTKRATALLSSESIDHLLSEKQLKVWNYIQENKTATPRELQKKLRMPVPTVLQILNKLLTLKKIERAGQGRAVRYELRKIG